MRVQNGKQVSTGSLNFANNYAYNPEMVNMPAKDFTVEFWARTPAWDENTSTNAFTTLFSYATHTQRTNICAHLLDGSTWLAIKLPTYLNSFCHDMTG